MSKIPKTILVDSEVWDQYQKIFPREASQFAENQMRMAVNIKTGDVKGLDVQVLAQQLEEKTAELDKISKEVNELKNKLDLSKSFIEKEQTQKLELKKAVIEKEEAKTKCLVCNCEIKNTITFRKKDYQLCLNCLSAYSPDIPDDFVV